MIKIGQIGIGHNHGEAKMLAVRKFPELFEVVGFAEENEEWIKKRGNIHSINAEMSTRHTDLKYDNALARVFVSSVECNGWGRRCFSVAGSDGTVEIRPLEVPVRMTFAKKGEGNEYFDDYAKPVENISLPDTERYDEMVKDFYSFIICEKENPFTYEHEYAVQEVLDEVVGGVKYYE